MPSTFYVPDTILGTWHTKVNKTGQKLFPLYTQIIVVGKEQVNQ